MYETTFIKGYNTSLFIWQPSAGLKEKKQSQVIGDVVTHLKLQKLPFA